MSDAIDSQGIQDKERAVPKSVKGKLNIFRASYLLLNNMAFVELLTGILTFAHKGHGEVSLKILTAIFPNNAAAEISWLSLGDSVNPTQSWRLQR